MKILFTFIILVLMGVPKLKAQELSRKIDIEKGYKYNGIYLDKEETYRLLKNNEQAYRSLKPAKINNTISFLLFSAGLAAVVAPLEAKIDNNKDTNPTHIASFIGIGLGLIAISIPIRRKATRQTKSAVELYNAGLSSNFNQKSQPELQIGFTGNGPGLIMKFK